MPARIAQARRDRASIAQRARRRPGSCSRKRTLHMSNPTVFSRLSAWLKPVHREIPQLALPIENEQATLRETAYTDRPAHTPVTTFLKPWAKRDAALQQL